jgi:hypothetical protein
MRQRFFAIAVICLLSFVFKSLASAAPSHTHLNWGSQLNQSECPNGTLVVNAVQKITKDADSGVGGNAWALDDEIRHIQVVQLDDGSFCATLSYQGSFSTLAGASPQNTGTVGDGVVGTFEGGYRSTIFTGHLLSTPLAKTKGSIGSFDYNCDSTFNCPGYVDWTTLYFSDTQGFDLEWWGWTYHAGNNGSWVNAIGGNSGDITGN